MWVERDRRKRLLERPGLESASEVRLRILRMDSSRLAALTGGSGFVGSHVAEALLGAGYRLRALARRPNEPGWLKGLDIELIPGDVRDAASLRPLVEGACLVVHAAGKTSARSLAEYRASNAVGTRHLVDATLDGAPGAHFILVSSQAAGGPSLDGTPVATAARGRPVSSYGWSKLEAEDEVRAARGLSYTILRPAAVYGPREMAIRDLFVATAHGFTPLLAGGTPRIQLAFVRDVARAVVAAGRRGGRNETFFVAHPEILDYRAIATTLAGLRNPPARILPVPAFVIRVAGVLMGLMSPLGKGPPVFNGEKAGEMLQPAWLCDVTPTQEALGAPLTTSFREGAELTWKWYREMGWLGRH